MTQIFKKIILGAAILCTAAVVNAQAYSFEGGANQAFYPKATGYMDCAIHIKNEGAENLTLKYKKVSVDFPSKWDFSFCDNVNCVTFFADSGTMAAIAPGNNESSMKVSVYPNGFADTAIVKYAIWNEVNPSKIDTLSFNVYVRWGASVEQMAKTVSVSPNPSLDKFEVKSNSVISAVKMFDLTGKEIQIFSELNHDQALVKTKNVAVGTYLLNVSTAMGTSVTRVVIQN